MASDYRPGSFQFLPVIIKNLLIINGLVWLSQITVGRDIFPFEQHFALFYFTSYYYEFWQVFTYMFLHSSQSIMHILYNMFALWMFGSTLENLWGPKRFLLFYLICGVGAAFVNMGAMAVDVAKWNELLMSGVISKPEYYMKLNTPTVGASGAVMGIIAAFAYTFPNKEIFVFLFPVKAKWLLLGMVLLDLFGGFSNQQSNIAHFAHLGGAAFGIIIVMIWNKKNRRTFY
jgi:membrane associated rhomboid family serine protease